MARLFCPLLALSLAAQARAQAPKPTAGPELRLNTCAPAQAASQQWTLTGAPADGTLSLTASRSAHRRARVLARESEECAAASHLHGRFGRVRPHRRCRALCRPGLR